MFSRRFGYKHVVIIFLVFFNVFVWQAVYFEETGGLLTVAFLDVGQGDSILILAPSGNYMLIDSGLGKRASEELSKIMPFHKRFINVTLATHPDADHIGGFPDIFEKYETGIFLDNGSTVETQIFKRLQNIIEEKNVRTKKVQRGTIINLGGGAFVTVLFPDRDVSDMDPNDASVVAILSYDEVAVMLTGDAPKKVEEHLVVLDGQNLQSDILKVGHHGSRTSTAASFVQFVNPQVAVVSAGKNNRYGHPHQEVLDVLEQFDVLVLETAEEGTIVFQSNGKSWWRR